MLMKRATPQLLLEGHAKSDVGEGRGASGSSSAALARARNALHKSVAARWPFSSSGRAKLVDEPVAREMLNHSAAVGLKAGAEEKYINKSGEGMGLVRERL